MSFGNKFAKNHVIYGANNSSSSHSGNCGNNVLVLKRRPIDDIINSVGEAKFSINFTKSNPKFLLNLH